MKKELEYLNLEAPRKPPMKQFVASMPIMLDANHFDPITYCNETYCRDTHSFGMASVLTCTMIYQKAV